MALNTTNVHFTVFLVHDCLILHKLDFYALKCDFSLTSFIREVDSYGAFILCQLLFVCYPHFILMLFWSGGSLPLGYRWESRAADGEAAGRGSPGLRGGAVCGWPGQTLELVFSLLPSVCVPVVGSRCRGMPWHSFLLFTMRRYCLLSWEGRLKSM